jgi:methylase of polypeptide subunit release factors
MILAKYLCKNQTKLNMKHKKGTKLNVLELGSGTGILGIYAACMGWNVILSDQAEIATSILKKNVDSNKVVVEENEGTTKVLTLDW